MRFFRKSWKYQVAAIAKYFILTVAALLSLYPFLWVLCSSLKDNNSIFGDPFGLPKNIIWENYKEVWSGADVGRNFFNSMVVCLAALALLIIVAAMGSYVLTRVWKNGFLSTYFSLGIMIPVHALLIPSVLIFKKLGLTDNLFSLVLMYAASNISFTMYILNGYFDAIPREMDEAATIDGCSRSQIFFRIIFPIAKPGIATAATLAFLNCWNDLVLSLVLISSPQKKTLTLAISALKGSYATRYGLLCAGFVISIVPVVIMYLLFQKQVISGMTAGAVKG
ncbi:MAG: carbohydrate ABC transporter permease [Eubacteriales bacterium]|nr:carbohydrate ABC transporter permease [Eubacteriales bacterium]